MNTHFAYVFLMLSGGIWDSIRTLNQQETPTAQLEAVIMTITVKVRLL